MIWRQEYELLTPEGQKQVMARIEARLAEMRAAA